MQIADSYTLRVARKMLDESFGFAADAQDLARQSVPHLHPQSAIICRGLRREPNSRISRGNGAQTGVYKVITTDASALSQAEPTLDLH